MALFNALNTALTCVQPRTPCNCARVTKSASKRQEAVHGVRTSRHASSARLTLLQRGLLKSVVNADRCISSTTPLQHSPMQVSGILWKWLYSEHSAFCV